MTYVSELYQFLGYTEITQEDAPNIVSAIVEMLGSKKTEMFALVREGQCDDARKSIVAQRDVTARYVSTIAFLAALNGYYDPKDVLREVSETIRFLRSKAAAYANTTYLNSDLDQRAMGLAARIQQTIYDAHYKVLDRTSMESIVTAYAPIAPYVGTTKVPWADELEEPDEEAMESISLQGILNFEFDSISRSIYTPESCYELIVHLDIVKAWALSGRDMKEFIKRDMGMHVPYYVIAFLCSCHCLMRPIPEEFEKIHKYQGTILDGPNTAQQIMGSMESFVMEGEFDERTYSAEELTADTNRILADARHYLDGARNDIQDLEEKNAKKRDVIVDDENLDSFDIRKIQSFINTAHRFYSNTWTTAGFLEKVKIRSVSYIDDYIVIDPEVNGNESEFLYVPVIDMMADRRAAVIRYHRPTGSIDIISANEYFETVQDYAPSYIHKDIHDNEGTSGEFGISDKDGGGALVDADNDNDD